MVNNKILVSCNLEQKDYIGINGINLKIGRKYESNYRERSPVIAISKENMGGVSIGDILICHHNDFYQPSPYWLEDDLYSIPFNKTIFLIITPKGELKPINGNLIAEFCWIDENIEIPIEYRKKHIDRAKVILASDGFKKGQLIFTRPFAPYEIVYVFNNEEKRIVKVDKDMVIGAEN